MDKRVDLALSQTNEELEHIILLRRLVSDFTPTLQISASGINKGIPGIEAKLQVDLWRRHARDVVSRTEFRRNVEKRIQELFQHQKYAKLVSPLIIQWREDGPDFKLGEHKGHRPDDISSVVLNYPEKKYVSVNVSELQRAIVLFHALKIYLHELYLEFEKIEVSHIYPISPDAGYERIELRLGPK